MVFYTLRLELLKSWHIFTWGMWLWFQMWDFQMRHKMRYQCKIALSIDISIYRTRAQSSLCLQMFLSVCLFVCLLLFFYGGMPYVSIILAIKLDICFRFFFLLNIFTAFTLVSRYCSFKKKMTISSPTTIVKLSFWILSASLYQYLWYDHFHLGAPPPPPDELNNIYIY